MREMFGNMIEVLHHPAPTCSVIFSVSVQYSIPNERVGDDWYSDVIKGQCIRT